MGRLGNSQIFLDVPKKPSDTIMYPAKAADGVVKGCYERYLHKSLLQNSESRLYHDFRGTAPGRHGAWLGLMSRLIFGKGYHEEWRMHA